MSRSASTFTVAVLFFFTFFAIFASAAPTNITCDEPDVKSRPDTVDDVPPVPSALPKVDNSTDTTNTTVVDDGSSDEYGVVNLESVNTLATSATYSGTVRHFSDRRPVDLMLMTPLFIRFDMCRLPGSTPA